MAEANKDLEKWEKDYAKFKEGAKHPSDIPLAESFEWLERRPGPFLSEVWQKYQIAWIVSIGRFRFTLIWFLAWHLRMPPWKVRRLRADFLSKEQDAVSEDGFWLRIQKLAEKDVRIGRRLQKFWQKVFQPWEGRGAHVGFCTVVTAEQSRLDSALAHAELGEILGGMAQGR